MTSGRKLRLGVWKFASCDGCQLTVLNCEDELLALADVLEIAHFPEATSTHLKGPYDISLVEGSITTPNDAKTIQRVRKQTRVLVSIGACATSGGIQALRNLVKLDELKRAVYPKPAWIEALDRSTPIRDHVFVDYELRGCPIAKEQLVELLSALLVGRKPHLPSVSVCEECKRSGNTCVLVARGDPCLGPVTHAGCGALCPAFGRGCYGCFGPSEAANPASLIQVFRDRGMPVSDQLRLLRGINSQAEAFRATSEAIQR